CSVRSPTVEGPRRTGTTASRGSTQKAIAPAESQAAQRRAAFLSQASSLLAESLDYETILERVARLPLPTFANTCVVHLLEGDRSIIVSADPAREALLRDYQRRWHARLLSQAVAVSGRTRFCAELTPEVMESIAENPEHLNALRDLGTRS